MRNAIAGVLQPLESAGLLVHGEPTSASSGCQVWRSHETGASAQRLMKAATKPGLAPNGS